MQKNMIKIDYDNIDVEDIMRQISHNLKSRSYLPEDLSVLDKDLAFSCSEKRFDLTELEQNVTLNNMQCTVQKASVIKSKRRVIGPIIVLFKRLIRKLSYWYVQFLFDQQNEFNSSVTNSINAINRYINAEEETKNQILEIFNNKMKSITDQVSQLNIEKKYYEEENEKLIERLEIMESTNRKFHNELGDLDKKVNDTDKKLGCLDDIIRALNDLTKIEECVSSNIDNIESISNIAGRLNTLSKMIKEYRQVEEVTAARLRRIEQYISFGGESLLSHAKDANSVCLPEPIDEPIDMDYFLFEAKYRGSRTVIKNRQKIYLDYFKGKSNVLDIGCGRGEFIEILVENNIDCRGIDLNMDNVNYCADRGLPVKYAEALEYLQTCNDSSIGGIFMAQVVEHLQPNDLIKLIHIARKKLQPGAFFIAETINPQSLIVFTESYYMDPSHIRPVHPLTIKFLVETEGYTDIELKYLSPVSDEIKIPKLECPDVVKNVDRFNSAISQLNNLIYGCRDYAIIAKR